MRAIHELADAEARAQIREALDDTMLVEAAAGTGKTTELVRRMVAILESGRATVESLVGVTFTEKAAGELRLRLRSELELRRRALAEPGRANRSQAHAHSDTGRAYAAAEEVDADDGQVDPGAGKMNSDGGKVDDESNRSLRQVAQAIATSASDRDRAKHNIEDALARLEEARLGTIHGFCAELLRERSVEAGVDPEFQTLDEAQSQRLFREAFDGWLEQKLAQPPEGVRRSLRRISKAAAPSAVGLVRRTPDQGPLDRLRDAAYRLVEWRDLRAPWDRPRDFDRDARLEEISAAIVELAEMTARAKNPAKDYLYKDTEPVRRLAEQIRSSTEVGRPAAGSARRDYFDGLEAQVIDLAGERAIWRSKGYGREYGPDLPRETVLAVRDALCAELQSFQEDADADLAALLQQELFEAVDRYESLKRRAGCVDFLDLLLLARNLLVGRADVRNTYQRRFTHLFVDEFQDTDPLQAEILLLLSADDPEETSWGKVRPRPGKLFLVGDPKQSIYRFRRADVGIYHAVKEMLANAGARIVHLTTSFRSVPQIQDLVNVSFEPWMRADRGTLQADYVALSPFRDRVQDQPAIVALPVPNPHGATGNVTKSAIEASLPVAVGAFVRWLIEESGWTVTERERPGVRVPIQPRHICLLFRRFHSYFTGDVTRGYVDALEARGVRHLLVGGRSFHDREEVEAMRAALCAIEWPDDELSIFATLRGPLFGIGDEELLRYRLSAPDSRRRSAGDGASDSRSGSAGNGATDSRSGSAEEGASHSRSGSVGDGASDSRSGSAGHRSHHSRSGSAGHGASHSRSGSVGDAASDSRSGNVDDRASDSHVGGAGTPEDIDPVERGPHGRFARRRLHPFKIPREPLPEELVPIAQALEILRQLHLSRNERPIADTIAELLERTRAHAGFALRQSGEQVLANVLYLGELARQYEAGGGISFRGFLDRLLEDAEAGRSAEAPILEDGSEGVRIMTVHKAKGLEFPVVILADPTESLAHGATRYLDPARSLCAMKLGGWAPEILRSYGDLEAARDESEGVRLAYVAATRARDLLVAPVLSAGEHPLFCPSGTSPAPRDASSDVASNRPGPGRLANAAQSAKPVRGGLNTTGWIGPVTESLYPARESWSRAQLAPGCPRPAAPENVPGFEISGGVRPGLHLIEYEDDSGSPLATVEAVWWDVSLLNLETRSLGGMRGEDLVAKVDPGTEAIGAERYRRWRQSREERARVGAEPELRVLTATEWARRATESRQGTESEERAIASRQATRSVQPATESRQSAESEQPATESGTRLEPTDSSSHEEMASATTADPDAVAAPSKIVMREDVEQVEVVMLLQEARPSGQRFGALVHSVLETVSLRANEDEIERATRLQARILAATEDEQRAAREAVRNALEHPLLRRAAAAQDRGECRRETPVVVRLDDGTYVDGVVDLAFLEDGAWTVVDYKTDRELERGLEMYRYQVTLYARSIALASGKPARTVLFTL